MLGREAGDDPGAFDVVLQGFARLGFHHRDVLVRRGVQDEARAMRREDGRHPGEVRDVADERRDDVAVTCRDELLLGLVEEHLALVEQQEPGRAMRRDLAAELEADAAARAGDEDDAALDHRGDGAVIELHGRTSEDVFDGDRTDVGGADATAGELGHRGYDQDAEIIRGGEGADFADAADAGGRQREDDLGDAELLRELAHPGGRADHGDAVDVKVVLGDVVVEEADRLEAVAAATEQVGDELGARLTGADDGDAFDHAGRRTRAGGETLPEGADGDAETDEQHEREVEVDQRDAAREAERITRRATAQETWHGQRGEGRRREGEGRAEGVRQTEVIEDAAELSPERQQGHLERDQPEQGERPLLIEIRLEGQMFRGGRFVGADEPEFIGEPKRERGQHPVSREEERGALEAGGGVGHGVRR